MSKAELRLECTALAKIQNYFQVQVENALKQSDSQIPEFLRSVKCFSQLGRDIYGFRWSSSSFREEEEAYGRESDRAKLLRHCLSAAMQLVREQLDKERRKSESGFVAMTVFLRFLSDILCLLITVFLFLDNKTWEAWTFVGVTIAGRLFHVGTVAFLQKGSCTAYLTALGGITTLVDAYRMASPEGDYGAPIGELDFGLVAALRNGGTIFIQYTPQVILTMYLIVTTIEDKQQFGGLLWIQILAIASCTASFALCATNFNNDYMARKLSDNKYHSMVRYIPPESKPVHRKAMYLASGLWYTIHYLVVCIGVGTLFSRTPAIAALSFIGGFILVVNLLRLIVNKGELRYFRRVKPTLFNTILSILGPIFVFSIGVATVPLSLFRLHGALGPTVYGFVWLSSFAISSGVVFLLVKDVTLLAFYGILCFLYITAVVTFLSLCREKDDWKTFVFSTRNWKSCLRGELWENVEFGSSNWDNEVLLGDEDAHYAGLVKCYLASDLPWDKLAVWLQNKKSQFLSDPPMWLSEEWLLLIPIRIRNEVWTMHELLKLKESINQAKATFQRSIKVLQPKLVTASENSRINPKTDDDSDEKKNMSPKGIHATETEGEKKQEHNSTALIQTAPSLDIPQLGSVSDDEQLAVSSLQDDAQRCLNRRISSTQKWMQSVVISSTRSKDLEIPLLLLSLWKKAEKVSRIKIGELVSATLNEEFAKLVIGTQEPQKYDDIPLLIIGSLLKHFRQKDAENDKATNVSRTLISAFFEIGDEVSDFVLAILFILDAGDFGWAAVLMFVFMGLNRFINTMMSWSQQESSRRICESILGIKPITDTYRLLTQGAHAKSGKGYIINLRVSSLGIGLVCESLPQMMLQLVIVLSGMKRNELSQGILAAQITSVLASCISIGFSFATISVDQCIAHKYTHPSGSAWVPNNGFQQTIILLCLVTWITLHVLLTACGFSILLSFAEFAVSLPIIFGTFFVFTVLRYIINDSGWRGLGWYSVKSEKVDALVTPIICIIVYVCAFAAPCLSLRYQCALGPLVVTLGVVSSLIISSVSLFIYIQTPSMQILFGCLVVLYIFSVSIFLANIDESLTSFLFSTVNWKETLRDELWDIALHSSGDWKIPALVGDHDANRAAHIQNYKTTDLPWCKIKIWLTRKKASFLEKPPLWMTPQWFDNLTSEVKRSVWKEPGELEELLEKVKEICERRRL